MEGLLCLARPWPDASMASAQGKFSGQVLLATLSVVGTRAMQVYTSAQFARARVSPHALARERSLLLGSCDQPGRLGIYGPDMLLT